MTNEQITEVIKEHENYKEKVMNNVSVEDAIRTNIVPQVYATEEFYHSLLER